MNKKFLLLIGFLSLIHAQQVSAAPTRITSNTQLRIVCTSPCPTVLARNVNQQKILQKFTRQLRALESSIGFPIAAERKPIEVHLTSDVHCAFTGNVAGAAGFSGITTAGRGRICLNTTQQKILKGETALLHELSHQYFLNYGDNELGALLEEVVTGMPSIINTENHFNKECHPLWENSTRYRYKLCVLGFNNHRVGELARAYAKELKASPQHVVTKEAFLRMLSEITGNDMQSVFE